IAYRIEKVKELLVYDALTLSEIADRLHYSSVAYLSNQFKEITGFTPSHFKTIRTEKRKPLDKVQKNRICNCDIYKIFTKHSRLNSGVINFNYRTNINYDHCVGDRIRILNPA